MSGLYLYGLLRGLDQAAPAELPTVTAVPGAGPARLLPVPGGHALVADWEGAAELDPTRRNLQAHMRVQEAVLAAGATVLPLRFGTILPDMAALADLLAREASSIAGAFARIDGQVELGLKASWPDRAAFATLVDADAGLRAERDRLATLPPAAAYFHRVAFGREVEARVAEARESLADGIVATLAPLATELLRNDPLDELMVLNLALLVARAHEASLDAAVQGLEPAFPGLVFRYVGPVPPYSFVSLTLETG